MSVGSKYEAYIAFHPVPIKDERGAGRKLIDNTQKKLPKLWEKTKLGVSAAAGLVGYYMAERQVNLYGISGLPYGEKILGASISYVYRAMGQQHPYFAIYGVEMGASHLVDKFAAPAGAFVAGSVAYGALTAVEWGVKGAFNMFANSSLGQSVSKKLDEHFPPQPPAPRRHIINLTQKQFNRLMDGLNSSPPPVKTEVKKEPAT